MQMQHRAQGPGIQSRVYRRVSTEAELGSVYETILVLLGSVYETILVYSMYSLTKYSCCAMISANAHR
jgi:hypothetical protein